MILSSLSLSHTHMHTRTRTHTHTQVDMLPALSLYNTTTKTWGVLEGDNALAKFLTFVKSTAEYVTMVIHIADVKLICCLVCVCVCVCVQGCC